MHHQHNLPTLTIITVSAYDLIRLKRTLQSISEISDLDVEHVTVLPKKDFDSIKHWSEACGHLANFRLIHDKGAGIYKAMNLGAYSANGKYLVFWNSGEIITRREEIVDLLTFLGRSKSPQVITQGEIEWKPRHEQSLDSYKDFIRGEVRSFISHQTYFIERNQFILIKGFSERYKVASDTELILKMSLQDIDVCEGIRPVFVENSQFASKNHRRARFENLLISFNFGMKHRSWKRFRSAIKQELLRLRIKIENTFEISSWSLLSKRSVLSLKGSTLKVDNFARNRIAQVFEELFLHESNRIELRRVAIVGGTVSDPEASIIHTHFNEAEFVVFGIQDAQVFFDLNEKNDFSQKKFDVVLVSQVLEHVWNHENFFNNISNILADDGLLWVACPMSNKLHGSPDYFSAGFTPSYLVKNLEMRNIRKIDSGGFGTKRLYFATHILPGWFTKRAHNFPLVFAFEDRKLPIKAILKLRFLSSLLFLSFVSPRKSLSERWFTESWFFGRKESLIE